MVPVGNGFLGATIVGYVPPSFRWILPPSNFFPNLYMHHTQHSTTMLRQPLQHEGGALNLCKLHKELVSQKRKTFKLKLMDRKTQS